jgi:hypothetical protein
MAKKIGISRPMVIDVLLSPFRESFCIDANDTLQQWHYDQTGEYLPDRAITPLILSPRISVQDPETEVIYEPSFYQVRWFLLNTATGKYDIEITNTEDGDVDYLILPTGELEVKKNVSENASVSLLCKATYIDPRNAGKTYTCSDTVDLTTHRDSSVTSPSIDIDQEGTVKYNPFIDASSLFTFTATVRLGDKLIDTTDPEVPYRLRWYAKDAELREMLIDAVDSPCAKFPCYVSGQGTPQLTVNAMYADQITIIARIINTNTNQLYPVKEIRSLVWDNNIKADVTTEAIDGGAIKQDTVSKTFRNIVTMRNRTLDASVVNANFLQTWKFRPASRTSAGGSTPTDQVTTLGTGPQMELTGARIHAQESSLVYSELELMGAYKVVKQGTAVVVQDNKVVICRF